MGGRRTGMKRKKKKEHTYNYEFAGRMERKQSKDSRKTQGLRKRRKERMGRRDRNMGRQGEEIIVKVKKRQSEDDQQ